MKLVCKITFNLAPRSAVIALVHNKVDRVQDLAGRPLGNPPFGSLHPAIPLSGAFINLKTFCFHFVSSSFTSLSLIALVFIIVLWCVRDIWCWVGLPWLCDHFECNINRILPVLDHVGVRSDIFSDVSPMTINRSKLFIKCQNLRQILYQLCSPK